MTMLNPLLEKALSVIDYEFGPYQKVVWGDNANECALTILLRVPVLSREYSQVMELVEEYLALDA